MPCLSSRYYCAMSLSTAIVRHHSAIAAVLFPVSAGIGFFYTIHTGKPAIASASSFLTGRVPDVDRHCSRSGEPGLGGRPGALRLDAAGPWKLGSNFA